MNSVSILLSTYNGEKYITELVDSLLAQKDVDIRIVVRDDGSSDNTIALLEQYHDERIRIFTGDNLKPARSFLELVKLAGDADYYAFCDQDDVWNDNKLINALNKMEREDASKPILYMSTYDVVDCDLNLLFTRDMKFHIPFKLQTTIMERSPSGCVMVFNRKLKELVELSNPVDLRMHDFWALMVAEAFHAVIVTDNRAQLKYRQHENNVVGFGVTWHVKIKRLIKSAIYGNNERQRQAVCFLNEYGNILPEDSKLILEEVANYKRSLKNRISFALNKEYRLDSIYVNALFIISVLLGLF